jgi:signal transduction histidine kinase
MKSRNTRVRSKVVALLVSLTALWAFAAYVTVREGLNMLWVTVTANEIGYPLSELTDALEDERQASVLYVSGDASAADELATAREKTDSAMAELQVSSSGRWVEWVKSDELRRTLAEFEATYAEVESLRAAVDRRGIGTLEIVERFTAIIDSAFVVNRSLATWDDKALAQATAVVTDMAYARELMIREDAIISGAIVSGQFSAADRAEFAQIVGARRYLHASAFERLTGDSRAQFEQVRTGPAYQQFEAVENQIMSGRPGELGVTPEAWRTAADGMIRELRNFEAAHVEAVIAQATPVAIGTALRLVLLGVLGLAAVIASIVISITTARQLVRQLQRLRNAARDLASYRLPRVVERLQAGEQVDVKQEAPPLEFGNDEIGQVGEAFNQVQETAIRVAVEQAELRRSVRDVFLSLARRSQALLHRQLGLLDQMERRATDAEELAELFRIDHLATRMRRNAENLIVLAGATAGRAWRKPVPMVDVLRGALAEVEDYTRVTVMPVGNASLVGRAVGDVIHLLAELIENAVSFSPPQTTVRVGGSVVGYGFAIEIEDRGLGMSPEELAAANEQLRNPPEFRLTSTARLGLYVVAKLAERHGIRVRLTESAYGGITAIVLLPGSLIVDEGSDSGAPADSGQLDSYRPAQVTGGGRHRLQTDADRGRAETATAVAVRDPAVGRAAAVAANGTHDPGHFAELATQQQRVISRPVAEAPPAAPPASTPAATPVAEAPVAEAVAEAPPAEAPATDAPAAAPEPPKLTPSGLPLRQRRHSPEPAASGGQSDTPGRPAAPARDPNVTRSMMASYRSGTLRGRSDAARLIGEQGPAAAPAGADPATPASRPPEPPRTQAPPPPWPGVDSPQWTNQARDTEEGG